ncbi:LysR family transcriptional regulator [Brevibacterium litoralis]|uniref:LysR family transcriptional regulator n=1 Tax=Brevibacterium litoralis TaxID=3138935 RepID=UPI0032F06E39
MWNLDRLRVWRAVVAAGSVNGAARNLQVAPAGVSQHIIALEKQVGIPLYHRSGRGIEITEAGRRLAEGSDDLFVASRRLDGVLDDLRAGPGTRVRIGCFSSAAKEWIPEVLGETAARHPELRFTIQSNEPLPLPDRDSVDIDIGNELAHLGPEVVEGYTRHVVTEDPYVIVVPDRHRLAQRAEVPLADLAEAPLIDLDVTGSTSGSAIDHAVASAGFVPRYVAGAEDHYAGIAMVEAGVGLTIQPALAVRSLPRGLVSRPLVDPTPVRRIVLQVKKSVEHVAHIDFLAREVLRVGVAS